MGIDVWERKSLYPSEPDPSVSPASTEVEAPAGNASASSRQKPVQSRASDNDTSATVTSAAVTGAEEQPRFRLGMYHYESVGVCLLLDEKSEMPRRLCDDIARSAGGNLEAVRFQELKWPMLETAGIDQSLDAAREVVTQKFHALPNRVIVFGAGLATYFQPLSNVTAFQPTSAGRQSLLLVPDLAQFQNSADEKRQFLRVLHGWQSA